jgi:hypothetical protein
MGAMTILGRVCTSLPGSALELTAGDTVLHSWEILAQILQSEEAQGIICDIGM